MTNTFQPDEKALFDRHHANLVASLNRRLDVAIANHDQHLIDLLEQERKQIHADSDRATGSLTQQLATLWDDFTALIRGESQVRVWQTVDGRGDRWWCAYNPQTGDSIYAESETELRHWIEQNYVAEFR